MGRVKGRLNQLRDPALFSDGGKVYLAYCGGGESGIGMVQFDRL